MNNDKPTEFCVLDILNNIDRLQLTALTPLITIEQLTQYYSCKPINGICNHDDKDTKYDI